MTLPLILSDEVAAAGAAGRPLVALESTIITHGMPAPVNLDTARAVEADVRAGGAIPATIAVMGGYIRVGLTGTELENLAAARNVRKLSRADLAVALVEGATGSTTVAATMICARLAGIGVFATGGIGGVHRGAEASFDISADLEELAQTPVTVVASGAKAILDLPKTLEVLETRGVPVITYGQDEFPAFWSRRSGLPSPLRLDDPALIAARPPHARHPRPARRPARRQPDPARGRDPGRDHGPLHRRRPRRGRARRHRRQGGDTVPPRPHRRRNRGRRPRRQYRAHPQQRPPCRAHRRGAGELTSANRAEHSRSRHRPLFPHLPRISFNSRYLQNLRFCHTPPEHHVTPLVRRPVAP